jgi:hypothetical protein
MSLDSTETSMLQMPKNYSREDLKPYFDYVEKEMNIMGVLSAFCALAPALAIKELLENIGPSPSYLGEIWITGRSFIVVATLLILAAAGFFYGQRSTLAWFYGQIALALIDPAMTGRSVQQWLRDADSWATWTRYKRSFLYLTLGAIGYSVAFGAAAFETPKLHMNIAFRAYLAIVVAAILIEAQIERIYNCYRYEESPLTFGRFMRVRMQASRDSLSRAPSFWGRK